MGNNFDIRITVPMHPKGKKSPRAGTVTNRTTGKVKATIFKDTSTRKWEDTFAVVAAAYMPKVMLTGPLWVDIAAVFDRPKYMLFKYKRTGKYKYPTGLIPHDVKPDSDNVRKSVQDALKAHWSDDKLICIGETVKSYREIDGKPRVSVRIREASPEDVKCAVYVIEDNGAALDKVIFE